MAPKVPKKPLKMMEKHVERPIAKPKTKKKKKNYQNFSSYIYKVLREVDPEVGITTKSMNIMNNFVHDMFEKLACEAGRLVAHSKKTTISSKEIQTAIKLLIPGELGKHANIEAVKAVQFYQNQKDENN